MLWCESDIGVEFVRFAIEMKKRDILQQIAMLVSWDFQRVNQAYGSAVESSIAQGLQPRQVIQAIVASNRCGVDAWTTLSATIEKKVRQEREQSKRIRERV